MTRLRAAAVSETGKIRRNNEDRYLLDMGRAIFGVADGVGGLPFGERAAQTACEAILGAIAADSPGVVPDLAAVLKLANEKVAILGTALSPVLGIATTLTMGCVRGGRLHLAHLGDSRCYGLEQARFRQLTEDHSVENEARRKLSQGQAMRFDPAERRAITRCLGPLPFSEPDLGVRFLESGNRYLFCTDGVTNFLGEAEIGALMGQHEEPGPIAQELIAASLSRGGMDNATAVVLIVD